MDVARGGLVMPPRRALDVGLAGAAAVVVALTLLPAGRGWSWGAPLSELHWYASGWDSPTAMLQLVGNLLLLADEPVPLRTVAAEIDALGAAALNAFAEQVPWTMPGAAP